MLLQVSVFTLGENKNQVVASLFLIFNFLVTKRKLTIYHPTIIYGIFPSSVPETAIEKRRVKQRNLKNKMTYIV